MELVDQNQRPGRWPDFARPVMVLRMLIMGALFSIILALSGLGGSSSFLVSLGSILLFVEWQVLVMIAIMALIRGWLEYQSMGLAFLVVMAIALIIMAASNMALLWWSGALEDLLTGDGREASGNLIRNLILGTVFVFATLQYLALFQRWKAQVQAEQGARMASLQARIRPHFLFNTLNTIANLVRTQPEQAEQAVLDLSDLLRTGLRGDDRHSLAEELELVRGYLRIESQRLGSRLTIDWRLAGDMPLDQPVPVLLIQPLIENAIVHGIAQNADGGTLRIHTEPAGRDRWRFSVENPLPPVTAGDAQKNRDSGNNIALENIRQRLELAYGERARLKTTRTDRLFKAELTLPIPDQRG